MSAYGGLNNDSGANNGAYPPRRFFNPHAPAFEPREPRYVQPTPPQQPTYASSAYSSYIQQPIGAQLQQQFRNLQQVYAPAHQPINIPLQQTPIQHQQIQNATKYHNVPMSQTSQAAYGINDHPQMMYGQNGATDYQQQQQMVQSEFQQFPISNELADSIQNSSNRMAILEVQIGLEQMSETPQEYELWSTAIKSRVAAGVSKEDAQLIAWLIVEMSYQSGGDNAQYSFARLCRLLDHEIKHFTTQFVIPRVAYFVNNGIEKLSAEHLSNFVVFIAEIYDKTEINGVRISRLGQYIVEQISIQLSRETSLNDQIVKSCVQVLKLTGRYIEEDQDPARLNSLFEQLNKLQNCPTLSSAVKNNIRQLNLLRERDWGVTKNEDFLNGSMNGSYSQGAQNEVVYGPDGVPLSEEEMQFLVESCQEIATIQGEAYNDEYEKEYEDFLHNQTEETAVGVAARALERLSVDDDLGTTKA